MTDKNNREFLADPVAWCKTRALVIEGPNTNDWLKNNVNYYSAPGDRRVWYFDIQDKNDQSRDLNAWKVDIVNQYQNGYRPCFWIPWRAGHIYKTTLHDKRSLQDIQQEGEAVAFFTAPMNGCSIFIEGTEQTPSVYHANEMNFNQGNSLADKRKNRTTEMERKWRQIGLPKRAQHTIVDEYAAHMGTALHGHHYVTNYHKNDNSDQTLATTVQEQLGLKQNQVLNQLNLAMVFGLKKNGTWKFYFQKMIQTVSTGGKAALRHYTHFGAAQFWPEGTGKVVLHDQMRSYQNQTIGNQLQGNFTVNKRAQWQPDNAVKTCNSCHKVFGYFKKHHCRQCGLIFCDACSLGRKIVRMPSNSNLMVTTKMVRVCNTCMHMN